MVIPQFDYLFRICFSCPTVGFPLNFLHLTNPLRATIPRTLSWFVFLLELLTSTPLTDPVRKESKGVPSLFGGSIKWIYPNASIGLFSVGKVW
jgi:hypothetical protein